MSKKETKPKYSKQSRIEYYTERASNGALSEGQRKYAQKRLNELNGNTPKAKPKPTPKPKGKRNTTNKSKQTNKRNNTANRRRYNNTPKKTQGNGVRLEVKW